MDYVCVFVLEVLKVALGRGKKASYDRPTLLTSISDRHELLYIGMDVSILYQIMETSCAITKYDW